MTIPGLRPRGAGEAIVAGRAYVVAGGSRGIGLEIVRRLAPTAERIDVWSRAVDELEPTGVVRHVACDLADPAAPLPEPPAAIHGLVYCPGTITLKSFRALAEADFRRDLEVNLLGAVRVLQACQPRLTAAEGGSASVVLFSTVAVAQGMPMHASIAAAKGAVEGLARSLAAEWAPRVRVNCLAPALVDTALAARLLSSPEKREALAARSPMRRLGTPADAAALACFLLSDESGWITGQVLGVDGGLSALRP